MAGAAAATAHYTHCLGICNAWMCTGEKLRVANLCGRCVVRCVCVVDVVHIVCCGLIVYTKYIWINPNGKQQVLLHRKSHSCLNYSFPLFFSFHFFTFVGILLIFIVALWSSLVLQFLFSVHMFSMNYLTVNWMFKRKSGHQIIVVMRVPREKRQPKGGYSILHLFCGMKWNEIAFSRCLVCLSNGLNEVVIRHKYSIWMDPLNLRWWDGTRWLLILREERLVILSSVQWFAYYI